MVHARSVMDGVKRGRNDASKAINDTMNKQEPHPKINKEKAPGVPKNPTVNRRSIVTPKSIKNCRDGARNVEKVHKKRSNKCKSPRTPSKSDNKKGERLRRN